ncbi:MAG TPA: YicC family protein [Crocinitomicaceae bacterium]|nr:YicC family protein [Flavobacteriales bacterium]HBW86833.1 YicC family protein [Crocinitomicaceae bacterium]
MTGFGKANGVFSNKKVSVEIRTLNSKGLDLTVKAPSVYRDLENEIRKSVTENLDRGKIDVGIYLESQSDSKQLKINRELADSYYNELKSLNTSWGEKEIDYLAIVMRMPEVVSQSNEEISEKETDFILNLVSEAITQVVNFRLKEGAALRQEFIHRLTEIKLGLTAIEPFESTRIQTLKERIFKSLEELKISEIDHNRFEQELIFYIEKLDISEEKMRLNHHLDYFTETMQTAKSGKKLGFITQEMGREINTLGSKSNHPEMQKIVVDMKDNLEKIKEQVLNTL